MTSHVISSNDFLLLGDGENIYLVCGGTIYHLKDSFLRSFGFTCNNTFIDCDTMGGRSFRVPGIRSYESEISMVSNNVEVLQVDDKKFISDILFQKYSIQELFQIVNRKIKSRDKRLGGKGE